jgi:3-deoxy-D-manno-octulosonic-acid transferase
MAYAAYRALTSLAFFLSWPFLRLYSLLRLRSSPAMGQRLGVLNGILRPRLPKTSPGPRVWIHAVSVGEAGSALAIIRSLKEIIPEADVILSVSTFYGHEFAKERLEPGATLIYPPLDFPRSVRRALKAVAPDALVCLETEIWPNFLTVAKAMGIRTAIVNGRISERSVGGYLKVRPLIRRVLDQVDVLSMIGQGDSDRIKRLGAEEDRIQINGNAKYDALSSRVDPELEKKTRRLYHPAPGQPVFVAGSVRSPEETILLDVYEKILDSFPDALFILFPRHIQRAGEWMEAAARRGFSCRLRTRLDGRPGARTAQVVIGDTIGELFGVYSVATLVFCGGSLAPKGGQNILEPAAWGKPVFYGPSMEDFLDAKSLLDETGGGVQVKDGDDLAQKVVYYFSHPRKAAKLGQAAKKAASLNDGAAGRHARVIRALLN